MLNLSKCQRQQTLWNMLKWGAMGNTTSPHLMMLIRIRIPITQMRWLKSVMTHDLHPLMMTIPAVLVTINKPGLQALKWGLHVAGICHFCCLPTKSMAAYWEVASRWLLWSAARWEDASVQVQVRGIGGMVQRDCEQVGRGAAAWMWLGGQKACALAWHEQGQEGGRVLWSTSSCGEGCCRQLHAMDFQIPGSCTR